MIQVTIDDLAFVRADAIARPVSVELRAVTPVMRRLEESAGEGFVRQLRVNEPLEIGSAVVTGGGALAAELVIHAVISSETQPASRLGVRRAMLSALQRAHDFDVRHLAVAPFGLGAGNLDPDEAAGAMVEAIHEHRQRASRPDTITVVVENTAEAETFGAACARVGASA